MSENAARRLQWSSAQRLAEAHASAALLLPTDEPPALVPLLACRSCTHHARSTLPRDADGLALLRSPQTYSNVWLPDQRVIASRPSLLQQLDAPDLATFKGLLSEKAPQHEAFWSHFPQAQALPALLPALARASVRPLRCAMLRCAALRCAALGVTESEPFAATATGVGPRARPDQPHAYGQPGSTHLHRGGTPRSP